MKIRIGTRGSKLALAQAEEVKRFLQRTSPEVSTEVVIIVTTGDKIQDRNLYDIGGKSLFTKEIEEALFEDKIDIAVHSLKDMPAKLPAGLEISCVLPREDVRDAFLSERVKSFMELPSGAVLGTSSVRRASQILRNRPDLKIVEFRGNVTTRIDKLRNKIADATILAMAGLKRINMVSEIVTPIGTDIILPAVAQGAIGIESMEGNHKIKEVLDKMNHQESEICITAERGFLSEIEGSCRTPIAALAKLNNQNNIEIKCLLASVDGKEIYQTSRTGAVKDAAKLGADAGIELKKKGKHILPI